MKKYKVKDIFSYVKKDVIDLVPLETLFLNGIDNADYVDSVYPYQVERYEQGYELEGNIKEAANELISEGKKVALIKDCEKIIAVIGYKEI